jgi:hypothetical protein
MLPGSVSCEMVLLVFKAIFTLVCLKRLVIFLMCGEVYVKVAHLVVMSVSVVGGDWVVCCCICSFNLNRKLLRMLLFCAISSMVFYSQSCQSVV